MAQSIVNLTSPDQIYVAFIQKGGRKAMAAYAKKAGISGVTLSHNVHGRRRQEKVLQGIANYLGCGVYDIMPEILPQQPSRRVSNG